MRRDGIARHCRLMESSVSEVVRKGECASLCEALHCYELCNNRVDWDHKVANTH